MTVPPPRHRAGVRHLIALCIGVTLSAASAHAQDASPAPSVERLAEGLNLTASQRAVLDSLVQAPFTAPNGDAVGQRVTSLSSQRVRAIAEETRKRRQALRRVLTPEQRKRFQQNYDRLMATERSQ
jgi:hypothetical protein